MKLLLLTFLILTQLISCSQFENKYDNNWICENKKELLKASIKADTVLIDLSKSTSDQLADLRNQLTWNPCNETNLLNGEITLSDSSKLLVAYRASPYCEDDTIIRPTHCFPDPTINIYFISDTLIIIENKVLNLNQPSINEKYFSFEDWNMFKNKIFEFHSHKFINRTVKENILKKIYERHFEILDSICLTSLNKKVCELNSSQIDSIKKNYPVYFAQIEIPTILENIDTIEEDLDEPELEIDLTLEE